MFQSSSAPYYMLGVHATDTLSPRSRTYQPLPPLYRVACGPCWWAVVGAILTGDLRGWYSAEGIRPGYGRSYETLRAVLVAPPLGQAFITVFPSNIRPSHLFCGNPLDPWENRSNRLPRYAGMPGTIFFMSSRVGILCVQHCCSTNCTCAMLSSLPHRFAAALSHQGAVYFNILIPGIC